MQSCSLLVVMRRQDVPIYMRRISKKRARIGALIFDLQLRNHLLLSSRGLLDRESKYKKAQS
ncbi:Uncharacterised protein [Vibrio cholerae]|nr:Uncharacterised protein [Vibrio cholerae]